MIVIEIGINEPVANAMAESESEEIKQLKGCAAAGFISKINNNEVEQ